MVTEPIRTNSDNPVIELEDSSRHRLSAEFLLNGRNAWGAEQTIGQLAQQFLSQNRGILHNFGIEAHVGYDGRDITVNLKTTTCVGALPLLSPTTGKPDYGLVIRPRYGWLGIGRMLSHTGWRVLPELLNLPQLPRSDRKVPTWIISGVVLRRIQSLLERMTRRFEMTARDRAAPRGKVCWSEYATRRISRAKFLDIPCRFPELSDDSRLLSAIHYTLRKHRASLSTQRGSGPMVTELLELCQLLIRRVSHIAPQPPTGTQLDSWMRRPLQSEAFSRGLQAIEWTVDDRGLAGLGDREGLAWMLPMEEFFESWIELLAERYARKFGGRLRRGRKRETVAPISWEPPWIGSQRALIPDVIIEQSERTVVVDAKYKSHWEDLNLRGWNSVRDYVREHHRNDILQVLAYANLADTKQVTACLVYPCTSETYRSLSSRGRHTHSGTLSVGARQIEVVLSAVPMDGESDVLIPGLRSDVSV